MQACAAGYALTYVTTLQLLLVSWTVAGLTADKFRPLTLPTQSLALPDTTYIWIYMV
jgi:hypothetical protein